MTEHEATIQSTSKGKRDIELNGLASLGYHSRLTQFLRGASRHGIKGVTTVIDFRPLYAVNVHNLQKQLVQEIKDIIERDITDRQLEVIRRLLDRYTNALRDFEFIHSNRWHTYFVKDIAASRIDNGLGSPLHSALISDAGLTLSNLQQAIFSDADILGSFDPAMLQHSQTLGETRATQREKKELLGKRKKHLVDTLQRFGFAVIGGLAIVGPVLILVAHTVDRMTLLVVCSSILLFSLGVALFSNATPEGLLAVTAAYASVLTGTLVNNIL